MTLCLLSNLKLNAGYELAWVSMFNYLCILTFHTHANLVLGHWKQTFLKPHSRLKIVQNLLVSVAV